MDDFFRGNAEELEKMVLLSLLDERLQNVVGEDAWELTKQLYHEAYISVPEKDMMRFICHLVL